MAVTLTLLEDAEKAYHALMTGTAVTKVKDQNGEEVTYTTANAFRLATYIQDMKRQLGQLENVGPMRAIF